MVITKEAVAAKLTALSDDHRFPGGLVNWAEEGMQDGDISDQDAHDPRGVARLGCRGRPAFGLTWEDCEHC